MTGGFAAAPQDSQRSQRATETTNKRDMRASLVSEVLSDLVEYLQMNDNYKQGKYAIFVPRQTDSSLYSAATPNTAGWVDTANIQELPLSRLLLNKNE